MFFSRTISFYIKHSELVRKRNDFVHYSRKRKRYSNFITANLKYNLSSSPCLYCSSSKYSTSRLDVSLRHSSSSGSNGLSFHTSTNKQTTGPTLNCSSRQKQLFGQRQRLDSTFCKIIFNVFHHQEKKYTETNWSTTSGNTQDMDKAGAPLTSTPSHEVFKVEAPNAPRIQPNRSSSSGEEPLSVTQRSMVSSSNADQGRILAKRPGSSMPPLEHVKRRRIDTSSPEPAKNTPPTNSWPRNSVDVAGGRQLYTGHNKQSLISSALKSLQNSCFDVLPTIAGRILFGRESLKVPGLSHLEKSVISDFSENQGLAKSTMSAILCKIKAEGAARNHDLLQSLCRVYVGLCEKTGDSHKAHALAYRLLREDFPEAPKLILLMTTAWPNVFSSDSPLCQAIHRVTKTKAGYGDIVDYLSDSLNWVEKPPGNILETIHSILKALLQDRSLTFKPNHWYGVDCCPATWDYIFGLDLLCTQVGWTWTFRNVIRKDIWPTLRSWLLQSPSQPTAVRDICVSALLRLLGRLGQLGLKERDTRLIQSLITGIKDFHNYGLSQNTAMSLEVQLSSIYAIHDLAPCNPKEALEAITSWQAGMTQEVPPAVTSCMNQIKTLCH